MKNLSSFDLQLDIKPSDVQKEMDCNGLVMTIFHLPRTKTLINGEEVLWVPQDGIADPEVALNQQLQINAPPQGPPVCIQAQKQTQAAHQDMLPASSC